jgi:hypothetical protein
LGLPGADGSHMERDLVRLRVCAAAISQDLSRTLDDPWTAVVTDDYVLALNSGAEELTVPLDRQVAVGNWPAEAWSDRYRESTLDDDAAEVVMATVTSTLNLVQVGWPFCLEHDRLMIGCSGVWVCGWSPTHDVARLGELD